ncbi:hypothetical protein PBI_MRMAGOO_83 [Mycobacterium phage MrMagoo]|uniref:Uncharacterized protein n=1 Tax=Mycobacterium phage MrMagoo TaxID=1927020 RepID=A0A1L6BYL3_9CAUD|nr:hypothetical protein J4U04_gp083 [Mycobacterium phage MrMagoo]APQ42186.1 hypothetical protein PBI_MRMAGOO_83 [Mycobacterium phage MrMagoo]ARM70261.1 hypothetical protein SEA_GARDENSALSA_83 [Mycobacterium phage GardenSalsa]
MSDIHWGGSLSDSGQIQVLHEQLAAEQAKLMAVRNLCQAWLDGYGPGSRAENVFGRQVISVDFIYENIVGLIDA